MRNRNWKVFFSVLFASAVVAGCAEHDVVGPRSAVLKPRRTIEPCAYASQCTSDPVFAAWSANFITDPIQTQTGFLDSRADREYTGFTADASVLSFASANPGKLYIAGDEPDIEHDGVCLSPQRYARMYHDYVAAVRSVDPTARFSPAGISDPADWCCPPPGGEPCRTSMHWISYADQFYQAYVDSFAVAPPVDEWRFHNFAQWIGAGDVSTWWAQVRDAANWSVNHGAHMVLGSWGFIGWNIDAEYPMTEFLDNMRMAMDSIRSDSRINQAVWWSYENTGYAHYLLASDGSLTVEGLTYVNLAPVDLSIGVSTGHMQAMWTNRNTANPIEIQFFSFDGSSWNPTSGPMWKAPGTVSADYPFPSGARVRFWARYITGAGVGPWSPLSDEVTIP